MSSFYYVDVGSWSDFIYDFHNALPEMGAYNFKQERKMKRKKNEKNQKTNKQTGFRDYHKLAIIKGEAIGSTMRKESKKMYKRNKKHKSIPDTNLHVIL